MLGFADDNTLLHTLRRLIDTLGPLIDHAKQYGLTVNVPKTNVIVPGRDVGRAQRIVNASSFAALQVAATARLLGGCIRSQARQSRLCPPARRAAG